MLYRSEPLMSCKRANDAFFLEKSFEGKVDKVIAYLYRLG